MACPDDGAEVHPLSCSQRVWQFHLHSHPSKFTDDTLHPQIGFTQKYFVLDIFYKHRSRQSCLEVQLVCISLFTVRVFDFTL